MVFGATLQAVTYDNCTDNAVNKRGWIGDESGPCMSVPAQKQYFILHKRYQAAPYSPRDVRVENC